MKLKIENYKKIKKVLMSAKQVFLNEKGQEIMPTLENLEVFRKELNSIIHLLDEIEDELAK